MIASSSFWARTVVRDMRSKVETFDGTGHFGMWQSEVLNVLFRQGLDMAIEEIKPRHMEETYWKSINRSACFTIRTFLSKEQRFAFSKETSAHKLWTALEETYLKKMRQNKFHMKRRLFRFTYVSGTTINEHVTSFNKLVTDLMSIDETFKDEDLAVMLLGSLPEEFEFLETILLHGKEVISLSEVCDALYDYELRKKDKQENSNGAVRGLSQSLSKGEEGRSESKYLLNKDECAFCHEMGHWKKDCSKFKK
ncbi:hypothetical protein Salat_1062100 [Sesamum alatum]|uniref:Retrovirus-related Pol polyprotein from transposon TNT 1-94 n=1 Tax=Sesamum alatum TaxID=300844 RepID=A0AAE1YN03_9LAMI|nr:hypothetical protein Salat_1062100 [Sesamum alatum]